jgi:hypothetical protein
MVKYFIPSILLILSLALSSISAYYSIIGLLTIFSWGVYGFIILEASKVAITAFLHNSWEEDIGVIRYLLIAVVVILMAITSMGIFGQLSKASSHSSNNVTINSAKVDYYESSIARYKANIANNDKRIENLNTISGKLIGDNITQASKERRKNQDQIKDLIEDNRKLIEEVDKLSTELLPYKTEVQKHEVEIGALISVTKFIYGDKYREHAEGTLLTLIFIIVLVFDPLAILMLISSQTAFNLARGRKRHKHKAVQNEVINNLLDKESGGEPKKEMVVEQNIPDIIVEPPVVAQEPMTDAEKMEDDIRRKRRRVRGNMHQTH